MTGILSFRGIAAAILAVAVTLVASPALAATTLFTQAVLPEVFNADSFSAGPFDASSYTNLTISFDYDLTDFELPTATQNDSLTYGYNAGSGDVVLGTVIAQNANGETELGRISEELPVAALSNALTIFVNVDSTSNSDRVDITNFELSGEVIVEEEVVEEEETGVVEETATSTDEVVDDVVEETETATSTDEVTDVVEDTATEEDVADTATTTDEVVDVVEEEADTATSTEETPVSDTSEEAATSTDEVATDPENDTTPEADTGSEAANDAETADKCEYEGHKYDVTGNPLAGWEIGLMKVITHNNGTDLHVIDTATTDADGFFCLRWQDIGANTLQGESTYVGGRRKWFCYC